MFDKILVPLDGSILAEKALQPALQIAAVRSGEIIMLQALQPREILVPSHGSYEFLWPEESVERMRLRAHSYFDMLREANDEMDVVFTAVSRWGDPASVIVDTAAQVAADLIVMTTHGYSGLTRWMLGSVAERVLRQATCPVLILRPDTVISHILVTLDGSDLAERALLPAFEIARACDARITLLRVEDPTDQPDGELIADIRRVDPGFAEAVRDSFYHKADDYLSAICLRHGEEVPEISWQSMVGKTAESIIAVAEANEVDTIAMTTHGRSGLGRWVYGSVTEKVLRGANRSMLIVRP